MSLLWRLPIDLEKIQHIHNSTILIVDDNPTDLNVLLDYLNDLAYKVLILLNGEQALQQVEHARPDLILLDVIMPGIDGFETCRRLKQNDATKDIPVIFMTALSDIVDKVKGFEVGGVDYITKPLQYEEVIVRVNAHLTIRDQQKQIRKQNQQLKELNASKDKFFSIIAHDLKSPFAGLFVIVQLIRENIEKWSKDKIKDITDKLQASVENLYALLENLLTWSRIQQGAMEYHPQHIDVRYVVARNVTLFTPNAEQKQITLRNSIQEQTVVYADVNMINTVVRNLLSNAIKFTKAGGTITVSAIHDENYVEVSVSDTGIGIPERSVPKLFRIDELFQKPGTAGEQGTGLGLILCKELVEKNGGKIRVESEVGKGTTVKFTLPKESVE